MQAQHAHVRVICLYRVSSKRQVEENDIPMQRKACRAFCQKQGWTIVREIYEQGVSGYSTDFQSREAIQQIKQAAITKEYDILLVYMFDRVGRKEFEVPALFQWLVDNNIGVWSTQEGEQKFETEADSLLAMIRSLMASSESKKLSTRIRTKHMQMAMAGEFRGGPVPYGYRVIDSGRVGRDGHPVRELRIHESEAQIVRMLFEKVAYEQKGVYELSSMLNEMDMADEMAKRSWRATTVRALLSNRIYIGQMHFGDAHSMPFEHMCIVSKDLFNKAQERLHRKRKTRNIVKPQNQEAPSFYDILYCAHCGAHLVYNSVHSVNENGSINTRYIYRCYNKLNYANKCIGQSTYAKNRVDTLVQRKIRDTLHLLMNVSEDDLVSNAVSSEIARHRHRLDELSEQIQLNKNEIKIIKDSIVLITNDYGIEAVTNMQLLLAELLSAKSILADELERVRATFVSVDRLALRFKEELSKLKEHYHDLHNIDDKEIGEISSRLFQKVTVDSSYHVEVSMTCHVGKFFGCQ